MPGSAGDGARRTGGGFAQLTVLWALLILGLLGMSFAYGMRTEAMAARNATDAVRAYYQARTGINRTVALLAYLPPDNVLAADLSGENEDGDAAYRVEVTGESGKVDINLVTEEVLKGILRNEGVSAEEAESVGDAILDWRDTDDRPRPRGAEEGDYASLPDPVRPRNGKLDAVEELQAVKGVTPDFYRRCLAKVFTAHGHAAQVNVNTAPLEVLEVLPGFTPELAAATAARRKERPFRSPAEIMTFLAGEGAGTAAAALLTAQSASSFFTVTSRGRAGEETVRAVRCLLEVGGSGKSPVRIVRWEDDVPSDEAVR